jgi:hypothetical protein
MTDQEQQCLDLVKYYGGWENVPAQTAQAISMFCPSLLGRFVEGQFRSEETDVNFAGWFTDSGSPGGGGFEAIIPSWSGAIEDFAQVATPMPPIIERGVEAIGNAVQQLFGPQEQGVIETGISSGPRCWTNPRYAKSRRVKIVKIPDPSAAGGFRLTAVQTCAPRKMNYCNPRALGRAARRLGGFQAMASKVEKVITHALRKKGSSRSRPRSCFPAKRRCR